MPGTRRDRRLPITLDSATHATLRHPRAGLDRRCANGAGRLSSPAQSGFHDPGLLRRDPTHATGSGTCRCLRQGSSPPESRDRRILRRDQRAALGWVREGREPNEREHRLTFGSRPMDPRHGRSLVRRKRPVRTSVRLHESPGFGAIVAAAGWLGGETTCALYYLLSERSLRPLTALALASRLPDRPVAPRVRNRLLFAWSLGTGVPILGVIVVGVAGLTNRRVSTAVRRRRLHLPRGRRDRRRAPGDHVDHGARDRRPGHARSARALDRVARRRPRRSRRIDDASEIGLLQAGFNRMADGLREREQHPRPVRPPGRPEVAQAALRGGARLGGEEREIGALFVDLIGLDLDGAGDAADRGRAAAQPFFRVVIEVVESEGGLVNKFEGDAALCIFGAPVASDDPAGEALRAARKLAAAPRPRGSRDRLRRSAFRPAPRSPATSAPRSASSTR